MKPLSQLTLSGVLLWITFGVSAEVISVADYSAEIGVESGIFYTHYDSVGSATFDDGGTLTLSVITQPNYLLSVPGVAPSEDRILVETRILNGFYQGSVFTADGTGSFVINECIGTAEACPEGLPSQGEISEGAIFSVDIFNGGSWEHTDSYFIDVTIVTTTSVISPVPVPAAAWLFGSALIGLAGIKRKK